MVISGLIMGKIAGGAGAVKPEFSEIGTELEIKILGVLHKAKIIEKSPFDHDNAALRA